MKVTIATRQDQIFQSAFVQVGPQSKKTGSQTLPARNSALSRVTDEELQIFLDPAAVARSQTEN